MPSELIGTTAPRSDTDILLDRLVQDIEDGDVVVVVGQGLLTTPGAGGAEVPLYSDLAARLAELRGIKFDRGDSLNTIASRYPDLNKDDLYGDLREVLSKSAPVAPPESLLKLAAIRKFKLFVSMTFDPLLETALNQVRFPGGEGKTQVFGYAPKQDPRQDLPCPLDRLDGPVVFHLLGRPTSSDPGVYAVTDGDILEFIHSLQEQDGPQLLFDALRTKALLIISCAFPDWLARFAIRAAQRQRLSERDKRTWVVDERLQSDADLAFFLEHSPRVKVFKLSGRSFVDQLHKRWTAAHPRGEAPQAAQPPSPAPSAETRKIRPVFLSYASEDKPIVEEISKALEQAHIDVWFDQDRLDPGAEWYPMIKESINNCELFVAILSQHTRDPAPRKFRFEWARALERADEFEFGNCFVIPVPIDRISPQDADPRFTKFTWEESLRDGRVSPEFVQTIVKLVRRQRSQR